MSSDDFVNTELAKEDLGHPDSAIRLASAVHRFHVPSTRSNINFVASFKSVGTNPQTQSVLRKANDIRGELCKVSNLKHPNFEQVINKCKMYIPYIHQILFTCKVQPEIARLDERLIFEWTSGVEEGKRSSAESSSQQKYYKSEAIMYDMVMTIITQGIAYAGCACDASANGDFTDASRLFSKAAGIFDYLEKECLPKWIARGTVDMDTLPSEVQVITCRALKTLFLAYGQQMAVATVLIKPGVPNYSLLGKLCYGIFEILTEFYTIISKGESAKSLDIKSRMDDEFFTLISFQINLHKSLSLYFMSRADFESNHKYGIAIAMLSEACVLLKTRTSSTAVGIPDLDKTKTLHSLVKDLHDLRKHMQKLLHEWEGDNTSVYFDKVPAKLSDDDKLSSGIKLSKIDPYTEIDETKLVPLQLCEPKGGMIKRSDSDLARELQRQLDMEG